MPIFFKRLLKGFTLLLAFLGFIAVLVACTVAKIVFLVIGLVMLCWILGIFVEDMTSKD